MDLTVGANETMMLAFNTFNEATSRKLNSAVVFLLTRQVVTIIDLATNFNPGAVTPKIIDQAIQDTIRYFRILSPKIADTKLEIRPVAKGQNDPINTARSKVRRNLVAMGNRIRRDVPVKVKTSEILKASMREELYMKYFPPKEVDPYILLQKQKH